MAGALVNLPDPTGTELGYQTWTEMAVEQETAQFLYGLVRLLKPLEVVESGTGEAYAAMAIGQALADNGRGRLHTFEPLDEFRQGAGHKLGGLPVATYPGHSADRCVEPWPDLVFLDSYGNERPREIRFWVDKPVVLVVHDAVEHREHLHGGTFFPTPRGLWLRLSSPS